MAPAAVDPRLRALLAWGWLVCYTALVFHLAVRPLPRLPELFGQFDKSLHALEYALLFWAASAAFLRSPLGAGAAYAALAYAVFVGALTEILQASVPGRLRLRALLAGRPERGAPDSVWIYRIDP